MHVTFQGREFPVHPVTDKPGMFKVMYLNTTRNIAGSVSAREIERLPQLLHTQARCCRTDKVGLDALEPRP